MRRHSQVLPVSPRERRSDERVGRLLRKRNALRLLPVALPERVAALLLVGHLPLRLVKRRKPARCHPRRRGVRLRWCGSCVVQTVLFALLLLKSEHAVRGLAFDLLLHKDLVLDRAVQFGEVGSLGVLELGEGSGRLRVGLESWSDGGGRRRRSVLALWWVCVGWLTHVRQGSRVERLLVVAVGTCPESEWLRTMPRRTVVTRHDGELQCY